MWWFKRKEEEKVEEAEHKEEKSSADNLIAPPDSVQICGEETPPNFCAAKDIYHTNKFRRFLKERYGLELIRYGRDDDLYMGDDFLVVYKKDYVRGCGSGPWLYTVEAKASSKDLRKYFEEYILKDLKDFKNVDWVIDKHSYCDFGCGREIRYYREIFAHLFAICMDRITKFARKTGLTQEQDYMAISHMLYDIARYFGDKSLRYEFSAVVPDLAYISQGYYKRKTGKRFIVSISLKEQSGSLQYELDAAAEDLFEEFLKFIQPVLDKYRGNKMPLLDAVIRVVFPDAEQIEQKNYII